MKSLKIFFALILTAIAIQFDDIIPTGSTPSLAESVQNLNKAFTNVKGQFSSTRRSGNVINPEVLNKIDESRNVFVEFLASHKYTREGVLIDRFIAAKTKLDEVGHYLQTMIKDKDLQNKIKSIMGDEGAIPIPHLDKPTEHHDISPMPHIDIPAVHEPSISTPATPEKPVALPHLDMPSPLTHPDTLEDTHEKLPDTPPTETEHEKLPDAPPVLGGTPAHAMGSAL